MKLKAIFALLLGIGLLGCATDSTETTDAQSTLIDAWTAAATGDTAALSAYAHGGGDLDAPNPDGATPLIVAALFGQNDAVGYLLDQGAATDPSNRDGATALHVAAFFGHTECVRLLLEAGAEVDAQNVRGETALDTVAGEWNPGLSSIYTALGAALSLDLNLEAIQAARPEIAEMLRAHSVSG